MHDPWIISASVVTFLVATLGGAAARADAPVKMVDLSRINARIGAPTDLNDSGVIVGWARVGSTVRMIQISNSGVVEDLGRYANGDTQADAINDRGVIVGHATTGTGTSQRDVAFFWTRDGGYQPLTVPGARQVVPVDINNRGQVLANVKYEDKMLNGPYIIEGEQTIRLPDLGHGPGTGSAINDEGVAAGYAPFGKVEHTVTWSPDDYAIRQHGVDTTDSGANDLSLDGTVVGLSGNRAFAWIADGSLRWDLGPGEAMDINDRGDIVGWSNVGYGNVLLWRSNGASPPVRVSTNPDVELIAGINNRGVVAGQVNSQIAIWTTDRL